MGNIVLTLDNLKIEPRMTNGLFQFKDYKIEYTDSLSLYYEIQDIFNRDIYNFSTNKANPIIIDAGSCLGISLLYFKYIYPNSKIIAFEPDPSIYSFLETNMRNNSISDVQLINAALGDKEGVVEFYPDGSDGGSIKPLNNQDKIEVPITKLSDYIVEEVDLLKINIEGYENEVIEEIKHKLDQVNTIIIEYHAFAELPQTLGNILTILEKSNFKYVVTESPSAKIPLPLEFKNNYKYFNLIYAVNKRCENE